MTSEPHTRSAPVGSLASPLSSVSVAPPFFAVSITKLMVMSFFSFGLYEAYWFYRNWQCIRDREGSHISAFWRTFFFFLYTHQLFVRVRDYPGATQARMRLAAGPLATAWIGLSLLACLPNLYGLLFFVASILCLAPVQLAATRINRQIAPEHDPNARFKLVNWLGIAVGASVIALALGGFFPDPAELLDVRMLG